MYLKPKRTIKALMLLISTVESYVLVENSECTKDDGRNGVCMQEDDCSELGGGSSARRKSRRFSCNNPKLVCCPRGGRRRSSAFKVAYKKHLRSTHNDVCTASSTSKPPDPSSGCCGREVGVANRIIGGSVTELEQYPWMALLEYRNALGRKMDLMCAGFLVSSRYVLTAKHCVNSKLLGEARVSRVILSEYDRRSAKDCVETEGGGEDCITSTVIGVESITAHPERDIALIRLEAAVPYTDFIRPICLPSRDVAEDAPRDLDFFVAGWGVTGRRPSQVKMETKVPFVPSDKCRQVYSNTRRKMNPANHQICAGGQAGRDSCHGDSGGPLMYDNGDYMEATGVISFGSSHCGRKGIPAVHANVHASKQWILENMID